MHRELRSWHARSHKTLLLVIPNAFLVMGRCDRGIDWKSKWVASARCNLASGRVLHADGFRGARWKGRKEQQDHPSHRLRLYLQRLLRTKSRSGILSNNQNILSIRFVSQIADTLRPQGQGTSGARCHADGVGEITLEWPNPQRHYDWANPARNCRPRIAP